MHRTWLHEKAQGRVAAMQPAWLHAQVGGRVVMQPSRALLSVPNHLPLSNHLSWMDILLLAGATGSAFVAKAELRGAPLVGWLCTLNRTLFVRRGDRMGIERQVAELRDALAHGWAITIFPEGTTGDGRELLPFKAALLGAIDPPPPGLMIQPVRIDYGAATDELAWVGDEPGQSHATRVLNRRGTFTATLHFLPPFAPTGGRKAIAAEARERIVAAGGDLSGAVTHT